MHADEAARRHLGERAAAGAGHAGEGVWLYDADGRRYLDGISSWWVNLFGHCNPRINAAIADQLGRFEHVMLAGFTHEPVVQLGRLAALTGGDLGHCFYASDGASATEIALKMSFHSWQNWGRKRKTEFVALAGGYHGETVGALAVTDVAIFPRCLCPLVRNAHVVPRRRPPGAAGRVGGRRRPACRRRPRVLPRSQRQAHRRADRRAAGAGRRRHGHARPRIPAAGARCATATKST